MSDNTNLPFGGARNNPGVLPEDIKKLYIRKYSTPHIEYDPLGLGNTNADFTELAFTDVEGLATEKSAAQLDANWYTVVNTFKTKLSALANWILGRIKDLSTTATEADLVSGNYLALDGSAGTKKLPAEDVAKRSIQDEQVATGVILSATASVTISANQESSAFLNLSRTIPSGSVMRIIPKAGNASVVDNYRLWTSNSVYTDVPVTEGRTIISTQQYESGSHIFLQVVPFDFVRSGGSVVGGVVSFDILFIDATKAAAYEIEDKNDKLEDYEFVEDVVYSNYISAGSVSQANRKRGYELTFGTISYWSHLVLPVNSGDVYLVRSTTSPNALNIPVAYTVDENMKILRTFGNFDTVNGETIVVCDDRTKYLCAEIFSYQTINIFDKLSVKKIKRKTYSVNGVENSLKTYKKKLIAEVAFDSNAVGLFTNTAVGSTMTYNTISWYQHNIYSVSDAKEYFVSIYTLVGHVGVGAVAELDTNGKVLTIHNVTKIDENGNFEILIKPIKGCVSFVVGYSGNSATYGRNCFVLEVEDAIEEVSCDGLPLVNQALRPYYYSYLDTKKTEIAAIEGPVLNKFSFLWLTDSHWNYNGLQSKFICKKMLDETSAEFVIHGGDFARAYGTSANLQSDLDETESFIDVIGRDRTLVIRGNHDFTLKDSADVSTGTTFPDGKTLTAIRNKCTYRVVRELGKYYFHVELLNGIVLVFLCTSDTQSSDPDAAWGVNYAISQDQIDWLEDLIKGKTNTKFILFEHIACYPTFTGGYHPVADPIKNIIDAVNSGTGDYSGLGNKVVACFSGHSHIDQTASDNGCAYVGTTCDAATNEGGITRTIGTTSEQAIDYVMIDFDNEQVSTIRIGGGSNRTVSFANS